MNPTERFSNRVENYRRYRPGYPVAVIDFIRKIAGLGSGSKVADIGSGTGIFTRLLLDAGWEVHAIEPNAAMREAAEADLGSSPRFHSVDSPAEATTLPDTSFDVITSAQAFHWFSYDRARAEFRRILSPTGWVFLIWNERREGAPFDAAYNGILASLGLDYEGVRNRSLAKGLENFFVPGTYGETSFRNPQKLAWDELRGRFLSSSYVPTEDDPRFPGLIAELTSVFEKHQIEKNVVLEQDTHVYYGKV